MAAAPNASSSPIAAISPPISSSTLREHFAKADASVIMGVGCIIDAPTAGDLYRQRSEIRRRPAAQRRMSPKCATVARSLTAPGADRCPKSREARRTRLSRSSKCSPAASVGGPAFVKACARALPVDQSSCPPAASTPPKSRSPNGSRRASPASGIGSKLITDDLLDAKDYAGIEKKVRDTIALDPLHPGEVSAWPSEILKIRPASECQVGLRVVRRGDAALRSRLRPRAQRALSSRCGKAAANTTSPAAMRTLLRACARPSSPRSPTTIVGRLARGPDAAGRRRSRRTSCGAPFDGTGRAARIGLNFTERGYGVRAAVGCMHWALVGGVANMRLAT